METGSSSDEYALYVRPTLIGRTMRKDLEMAIRMTENEWRLCTTFEQLYEDCFDDNNILFVIQEGDRNVAFMLLMLFAYPHGKVLNVHWSGGTKVLANIPKLVRTAEQAAEYMNASWIQMSGRPAWQRLLAPHNFRPVSINIGKEPDYVLRRRQSEGNADDKAGAISRAEGTAQPGDGDDQADGREPADSPGSSGS